MELNIETVSLVKDTIGNAVRVEGVLQCKTRDDIPRPGQFLAVQGPEISERLERCEGLLARMMHLSSLPPTMINEVVDEVKSYFREER